MAKTIWGLVALAITTGTAVAQPGATPPMPEADAPQLDQPQAEQPPQPEQPPPGEAEKLVGQLIEKVHDAAPTIGTIASGTWRRFRRSISIGPTAGLWSGAIIDPGNVDVALTFGIGLERFKVPVLPTVDSMKELLIDTIKDKAKDRLKQIIATRHVEVADLERLAKEIYQEVRNEVLGLHSNRAKTVERPSWNVAIEANRLFLAERWLGRVRAGIGIWKLTVGASLAVGRVCRSETCDDGLKLFVGPEVVLHAMTSKDPRSSVVDVFLRGDFQANSRGMETYDHATLGLRFLLDVI